MFKDFLAADSQSFLPSIADCHIKRLGLARTLIGGGAMYLSIPTWIIFHVTFVTIIYEKLMLPLFGVKKVKWSDHVIMDRHRIEGLFIADKINCLFCGYANGITTMLNIELDNLHYHYKKIPIKNKILAAIVTIIFVPFIIVGDFICVRLNYDYMIAPFLGMHTTSYSEVQKLLRQENYGKNFNPLGQWLFTYAKNVFTRMALLLEQIESSWCPLKHLERRNGVVYPKHHEKFLRADQLDVLKEILTSRGTVSDRLPKELDPFFNI